MPFPMKIQPLDPKTAMRTDQAKPPGRSRLKRLFERQIPSMLRISSSEKLAGEGRDGKEREEGDPEPSSVCLDRMILSFIEESNDKPSRCGRSRCNCFNGNSDDSSEDDFAGGDASPIISAVEILKGLVPCVSVMERNLLADASRIIETAKIGKEKDDIREIVANGLEAIGYDASVCKSRWEKTSSFPAGEYEFVDVIVAGERVFVDVDFRSEFEIARSTKTYRAVLQTLPSIFVGKADRLKQIVAVVSEAARQSLKKKGLHFPPWRKPEYMQAKWLSMYQRTREDEKGMREGGDGAAPCPISAVNFNGEFEMRIEEKITVVISPWEPPAVRPKAAQARVVTGLASVLTEKT